MTISRTLKTLLFTTVLIASFSIYGTAYAVATFDAASTGTSHTSTGSDRVIYTMFFTTGGDTVTAVTIGGLSYTKLGSIQRGDGTGRYVSLWYRIGQGTGPQTISVTGSYALIASASYTGADQTTQPDNSFNTGTVSPGTSLSVSNTSTTDGSLLIGAFGDRDFIISAGAGTQIRANAGSGVGIYDATSLTSPAGSKTLTVTPTSSDYMMGIVAHIRPSAAAPVAPAGVGTFYWGDS